MSEQTSTDTRAGALGAAALGTDLLREAVLSSVRDVHGAITTRLTGPRPITARSGPVRMIGALQGGVAGATYAGIDRALSGASTGLRAADRAARSRGCSAPLEDGARGRLAVAALNGLFGDRIQRDHPGLEVQMAPRRAGRDVPVTPEGLRAAYPEAGEDVVVLVHGLSEDDGSWGYRAAETGGTYAGRLRRELGWSPVVLRMNTGLPIAENGVALASLLGRLVDAWPVPVRRLSLVGHSMGGLVIRSACAVVPGVREPGTRSWSELVTDVITLGTPHLGAPIAWGLSSGVSLLALVPEAAPFGRFLDHRSRGIFDLTKGLPPDVVNLPSARYHLVAATVGARPRGPVSLVAGDGLVGYDSAIGQPRGRAGLFPDADVLHLPESHHFDLLNHRDVYAAMERWLGRGSGPVVATGPVPTTAHDDTDTPTPATVAAAIERGHDDRTEENR